jgi:hypothetical protein
MNREYNDLLTILADVRRKVPDGRYIWCAAADGFETTVSHRQGLILGGAWSPHFLRDQWSSWWNTPWTVNLRLPAIVRIEKAVSPISEWIPLMEAIAQAGESLLIVTREISSELLHTLIVNALKETLGCCVVRAAENLPGWGSSAINTSWEFVETPPRTARNLPKAAEAWSRRNATVLFPSSESEWRTVVNDITVISVGGKNQDDQHDRLRFLVETIQDELYA